MVVILGGLDRPAEELVRWCFEPSQPLTVHSCYYYRETEEC